MWRSGQDRIGRKVSQVPRDALQHGGGGAGGGGVVGSELCPEAVVGPVGP